MPSAGSSEFESPQLIVAAVVRLFLILRGKFLFESGSRIKVFP